LQITYLVSQFPKISETFVLGQITGLIDKGHEVEIIALSNPSEETVHEDVIKYNLMEKVQYVDYRSNELGLKLEEKLVNSLIYTDIIHAHFAAYPATWALRISEMFGVPFIFTAHAYDIYIDPDVDILRQKFDRAIRVITISEYNKDYLLNLVGEEFNGKLEVIRCGINLNDFRYIERTEKDNITILFVGRLVEKKGTRYALEAFSKLANQHENVELRIIGDGPLQDEIIGLIDRSNLKEKIHLMGAQNKSEVIEEMYKADIFFLPSVTADNGDREGIPVSIIEAQATGLPVVSTLHSGIPEVVSDGQTGFLVQEKDTDTMAEKLEKLIQDPELRAKMGKEGSTNVMKNHNREKELDQLNKLFAEAFHNETPISDTPREGFGTLNDRIQNLAKLLHKLDNELQDEKDKITKFGSELKRKDKEIKEKGDEIKQKNEDIRNKNEDIRNKNEAIHKLQSNLDYIHSKTAYKIYIALKGILDKIKNLFGSIPEK